MRRSSNKATPRALLSQLNLEEATMPVRGKDEVPYRVKYEIQNLLACHVRELVYVNRSQGTGKNKQEDIMEVGYHGDESHQSLLTLFLEGKSPYTNLFERTELENNRPGNEERGTGFRLTLKPAVHRHFSLSLDVHENGFTREALAIVRGARVSGRNLKDRYDNCTAMYKHALVFANEFLQDGNFPSGTPHEDLLEYVRKKIYVQCKGAVDMKSVKKDGPPVTEEECPEEYLFNVFFAFATFGPQGISGISLSCLSEDGAKVPRQSRADHRKADAQQKQKDREAGKGGHVPAEYVRGAPLQMKAAVASITQRDDIERRANIREHLFLTEQEDKNGWDRYWKLRSEVRAMEQEAELTSDEIDELGWMKQQLTQLRYNLGSLSKRKSDYNQKALELMSAPAKRQVTAFEEQVGQFGNPGDRVEMEHARVSQVSWMCYSTRSEVQYEIDESVDQDDLLRRHELETTALLEISLATRRETTESKRAFVAVINLQEDLRGEIGSSRLSKR